LKFKWNELKAGPDIDMEMTARQQMAAKIRGYADRFVNIITEFEESKMARAY
jgi:hypothetical protein